MQIFYSTQKREREEFIGAALSRCGAASPILRTGTGKPYLAGGEVQFSLTHTEGLIALAAGGQAVGLDAERMRPLQNRAILARLTPAEREEDFFELWTAKEAYVKYRGGTLASLLPSLVYEKGALTVGGAPADVSLQHFRLGDHVLCLCTGRREEVGFVEI